MTESPGWSQLSQTRLKERLANVFDGEEEVLEPFGMQLTVGPKGVAQKISRGPKRLRLWSKSRGEMVQFDETTCAYNILTAYTKFEDHIERLGAVMGLYVEEAKPSGIAWAGQRYINKVELPVSGADPASFFAFYPKIPTGSEHRPFAMQFVAEVFAEGEVVVSLNFQGIQNDKAIYFLDLYVRSRTPLLAEAESVVAWQKHVHEAVRKAFKMALTPEAISSFGGHP